MSRIIGSLLLALAINFAASLILYALNVPALPSILGGYFVGSLVGAILIGRTLRERS